MKTEIEINEDIIKITKTIKETYPELLKFISEMPIHINYETNKLLDLKYLQEYYNSLETLLKKYSNTHQ
jgi:hypothetical protein